MCTECAPIPSRIARINACTGSSAGAKICYQSLVLLGIQPGSRDIPLRCGDLAEAMGCSVGTARIYRHELEAAGVIRVREEYHCQWCTHVDDDPWPQPCPECGESDFPYRWLYVSMLARLESREPAAPVEGGAEEGPLKVGDEIPEPTRGVEGYMRCPITGRKVNQDEVQVFCPHCRRYHAMEWVPGRSGAASGPKEPVNRNVTVPEPTPASPAPCPAAPPSTSTTPSISRAVPPHGQGAVTPEAERSEGAKRGVHTLDGGEDNALLDGVGREVIDEWSRSGGRTDQHTNRQQIDADLYLSAGGPAYKSSTNSIQIVNTPLTPREREAAILAWSPTNGLPWPEKPVDTPPGPAP